LNFAYCDFYQRNPRSHLANSASDIDATNSIATPIATARPSLRPSLSQ
jgi:hypothetical protein